MNRRGSARVAPEGIEEWTACDREEEGRYVKTVVLSSSGTSPFRSDKAETWQPIRNRKEEEEGNG
jgi:hypothetical protein